MIRLTASGSGESAVTGVSSVCSSLVILSTGIPNDWMKSTSCEGSRSLRLRAESTNTGMEVRIILSLTAPVTADQRGNRFDQSEAYLEHVDPEHLEQGGVGLLLELGGDGGDVGGAGLKIIDQ